MAGPPGSGWPPGVMEEQGQPADAKGNLCDHAGHHQWAARDVAGPPDGQWKCLQNQAADDEVGPVVWPDDLRKARVAPSHRKWQPEPARVHDRSDQRRAQYPEKAYAYEACDGGRVPLVIHGDDRRPQLPTTADIVTHRDCTGDPDGRGPFSAVLREEPARLLWAPGDGGQLPGGCVQGQVGLGARGKAGASQFRGRAGLRGPTAVPYSFWSGIGEQAELISGALACEFDSGRVWIRVRLG